MDRTSRSRRNDRIRLAADILGRVSAVLVSAPLVAAQVCLAMGVEGMDLTGWLQLGCTVPGLGMFALALRLLGLLTYEP